MSVYQPYQTAQAQYSSTQAKKNKNEKSIDPLETNASRKSDNKSNYHYSESMDS